MHGYSPVEYFGILSGFVTHYAEKRKGRGNRDSESRGHSGSRCESKSQCSEKAHSEGSETTATPTLQSSSTLFSTISKVLNRTLRVMLAAWVSLGLLVWIYTSTWNATLDEIGYFQPYLW